MLDLRRFRTEPDAVRAGLSRRGGDAAASVDRIIELDAQQRAPRHPARRAPGPHQGALEGGRPAARAGRRRGRRGADGREPRPRRRGEGPRRARPTRLAAELRELLLRTPEPARRTTAPTAPARRTTSCSAPRATTPTPTATHQRVPHWDIGTELGILDGERAAKISGSMFMLYRGWGARLLRAMVQLSLDRNADAYEELRPPTLVRTDTMIATGHLPKFEDEAYHMERDDLWAIPTAEVPLTSLHRDEVLAEADLPAALHRPHVVLPARGGRGRARHPRAAPRARVRQGRAARAWPTDAEQAIACQEDILARSEALLTELGLAVPRARPLHRRPRRVGRPHLGPRGVRPGLRPVARGELGVVVQRLPGPAGQHPLPARPAARAPRCATR